MRKIQVLLADDEPVILRGLKKLLPWEEMGIDIVGEAFDGNELRDLIERCSPDLVISDISMPGCSGIDIIREIHAKGLPVKVIFISAYQEFSYAHDAVKYGAIDYLVKPVNKNQFEQVVLKAISLIHQQTEGALNRERLVHYEQKKRTDTIEELLDRIMDGDMVAVRQLEELGVVAVSRFVTVCLAEIDRLSDDSNRWEEREKRLLDFAISNVIAEAVAETGNGLPFRKGNRFGILFHHEHREEPQLLAADLHNKISTYLKLKLSVGIGRPVAGISEAAHSYRDAADALLMKYFVGLNRVIPYEPAVPDSEARLRLARLQLAIAEELRQGALSEPGEMVKELLLSIASMAGGSKNAAVSTVYSTLMLLEQELRSFGIPLEIEGSEEHPLLDRLSALPSFKELEAEVIKLVYDIRKQVADKTGNKEIIQLTQVKNYIEEHYDENITLESMAAIVFMNPYYFSSFFKKHTGENFKTYVTEIRMKHALRLLMQSDLMVYEIADRVGYNNARHFSDMFKKKFGKLPQEYKHSGKEH